LKEKYTKKLQEKYKFSKSKESLNKQLQDWFVYDLLAFWFDCELWWFWILDGVFSVIDKELKEERGTNIKIEQIKEKFWELRIYISGGNDRMWRVVSWAEDVSKTICEICWTSWTLRKENSFNIQTLCNYHK
jgi:hypothetical protein